MEELGNLTKPNKVLELQSKLYEKAKLEPKYRFYTLYDKVYREDILQEAYRQSKSKAGIAGVDGVTFEQVEEYGSRQWLFEMSKELEEEKYKPQPVMRINIPKAGGGSRPLGIPTIKDRVVQTALKIVIEPIFEADFGSEMYGYRPNRSATDAVAAVDTALKDGYTQVVDADISKYFDTIPHKELLQSVARRIADGKVLKLIKMWLKSPVKEEDGTMSGGKKSKVGTPQGGVISPILANIYMNRMLKYWKENDIATKLNARIITYADDFVILSKHKGKEAMELTKRIVKGLKLTLNETKTSLKDAWQEPFKFLGYKFGVHVFTKNGNRFMSASPSKEAFARIKLGIKSELRNGNMLPMSEIAKRVNRKVRGWCEYFNYANCYPTFKALRDYTQACVRRFVCRRCKISTQGFIQFPADKIFGEMGFLSPYNFRKLAKR